MQILNTAYLVLKLRASNFHQIILFVGLRLVVEEGFELGWP